MKTSQKLRKARDGAALFTVLVIILTVSALLATVMTASMNRSFMARKLAERVRAVAIAEAGAHQAYSVLATNFNARTNPAAFPLVAYGGGTYDVNVVPVTNNMAVIRSTGVFGSATETVALDVKRHNTGEEGSEPTDPAYGYSVVSGGEISWTGSGVFSGAGKAHANGKFKQAGSGEINADCYSSVEINLNGNSGFIDGDASAPQITGKTGKITGSQNVGAVPEISIPDIDYTPYYNHASSHSEVHNGNLTISGDYTPDGGILWVNGKLTISGNGTVTGCFIATGNISISGNATQVKVETYPAFMSRDGDIDVSGSATMHGLLYAGVGEVEFTGGGEVTGTVICGADFKKAGASTLFNYEDSTPGAPGSDPDPDYVLGVSAWQE